MTPEEQAVIDASEAYWRALLPYGPEGADGTPLGDLWEAIDALLVAREPAPEWVPTIMMHCLAGDQIRLGTQETAVLSASLLPFHSKVTTRTNRETGKPWDSVERWDHLELRMSLEVDPRVIEYRTGVKIEMLCTPERKAKLALQEGFPGTIPVDK